MSSWGSSSDASSDLGLRGQFLDNASVSDYTYREVYVNTLRMLQRQLRAHYDLHRDGGAALFAPSAGSAGASPSLGRKRGREREASLRRRGLGAGLATALPSLPLQGGGRGRGGRGRGGRRREGGMRFSVYEALLAAHHGELSDAASDDDDDDDDASADNDQDMSDDVDDEEGEEADGSDDDEDDDAAADDDYGEDDAGDAMGATSHDADDDDSDRSCDGVCADDDDDDDGDDDDDSSCAVHNITANVNGLFSPQDLLVAEVGSAMINHKQKMKRLRRGSSSSHRGGGRGRNACAGDISNSAIINIKRVAAFIRRTPLAALFPPPPPLQQRQQQREPFLSRLAQRTSSTEEDPHEHDDHHSPAATTTEADGSNTNMNSLDEALMAALGYDIFAALTAARQSSNEGVVPRGGRFAELNRSAVSLLHECTCPVVMGLLLERLSAAATAAEAEDSSTLSLGGGGGGVLNTSVCGTAEEPSPSSPSSSSLSSSFLSQYVNARDGFGNTPLHVQVMMSTTQKPQPSQSIVLSPSSQQEAPSNHDDADGMRMSAEEAGLPIVSIIRLLIAHGADVNATNDEGLTPLMLCGSATACRALLFHHQHHRGPHAAPSAVVDVDAVSNAGNTALLLAMGENCYDNFGPSSASVKATARRGVAPHGGGARATAVRDDVAVADDGGDGDVPADLAAVVTDSMALALAIAYGDDEDDGDAADATGVGGATMDAVGIARRVRVFHPLTVMKAVRGDRLDVLEVLIPRMTPAELLHRYPNASNGDDDDDGDADEEEEGCSGDGDGDAAVGTANTCSSSPSAPAVPLHHAITPNADATATLNHHDIINISNNNKSSNTNNRNYDSVNHTSTPASSMRAASAGENRDEHSHGNSNTTRRRRGMALLGSRLWSLDIRAVSLLSDHRRRSFGVTQLILETCLPLLCDDERRRLKTVLAVEIAIRCRNVRVLEQLIFGSALSSSGGSLSSPSMTASFDRAACDSDGSGGSGNGAAGHGGGGGGRHRSSSSSGGRRVPIIDVNQRPTSSHQFSFLSQSLSTARFERDGQSDEAIAKADKERLAMARLLLEGGASPMGYLTPKATTKNPKPAKTAKTATTRIATSISTCCINAASYAASAPFPANDPRSPIVRAIDANLVECVKLLVEECGLDLRAMEEGIRAASAQSDLDHHHQMEQNGRGQRGESHHGHCFLYTACASDSKSPEMITLLLSYGCRADPLGRYDSPLEHFKWCFNRTFDDNYDDESLDLDNHASCVDFWYPTVSKMIDHCWTHPLVLGSSHLNMLLMQRGVGKVGAAGDGDDGGDDADDAVDTSAPLVTMCSFLGEGRLAKRDAIVNIINMIRMGHDIDAQTRSRRRRGGGGGSDGRQYRFHEGDMDGGVTPLMAALEEAFDGDEWAGTRIVALLLGEGCDVGLRDEHGRAALERLEDVRVRRRLAVAVAPTMANTTDGGSSNDGTNTNEGTNEGNNAAAAAVTGGLSSATDGVHSGSGTALPAPQCPTALARFRRFCMKHLALVHAIDPNHRYVREAFGVHHPLYRHDDDAERDGGGGIASGGDGGYYHHHHERPPRQGRKSKSAPPSHHPPLPHPLLSKSGRQRALRRYRFVVDDADDYDDDDDDDDDESNNADVDAAADAADNDTDDSDSDADDYGDLEGNTTGGFDALAFLMAAAGGGALPPQLYDDDHDDNDDDDGDDYDESNDADAADNDTDGDDNYADDYGALDVNTTNTGGFDALAFLMAAAGGGALPPQLYDDDDHDDGDDDGDDDIDNTCDVNAFHDSVAPRIQSLLGSGGGGDADGAVSSGDEDEDGIGFDDEEALFCSDDEEDGNYSDEDI